MTRLTIARSLLIALVGLTLALAAVAGLSVASLYEARQDYEDSLSASYAAEVAAANLVAAGVGEETVLRSRAADAAARARAAATFDRAAAAARATAAGDPESLALVGEQTAAQRRARAAARAQEATGGAAGGALARAVVRELRRGRRAAAELAGRQVERRAAARERAESRSQRAVVAAGIAGGLALIAALALVSLLVNRLRAPLDRLVHATRRLASGDTDVRVEPDGPPELRELAEAFNAMAADLTVARARVEDARRHLASVIESLGDALVVCDAYGRITAVNPRAGDLLPELAPGHSLAEDPGPLPVLDEALDRETQVAHRDRTLSVTAVRLGPSREDGVVFTVRDVTERARLERAKSEFVSTASHELRSPLTSIKGFVELLAGGELAPRQREFVDVILLSTNRLVDLVNDLLDVARVEAGQLQIQRRPTAVGEAVREVVALMGPRLAEKEQELTVDVAPALPRAQADPTRVRQIITNLVTNAHLYTPQGGRIAVRAGASNDHVSIAVADTGRGMDREHLDRLFERFHRGDGSGAPGTGLGMSIVKSLVDLHDGEIEVDSTVGKGTTVTVRLPRSPADDESPREALRRSRVLIVEDEPAVASLIAEHLAPYEVETVPTGSGEEALQRLRAERFDAVTLDILLGGEDGFGFLRALRDDPDLRRVPVVVVSVLAGEEALSGEWTVSKPIDADELVDAIGSAILAGRARVLVVARAALRSVVAPMLDQRGIEFDWATSGAEAARLCEERRFEVALVDAGMRAPQAALAQLDLRGRRLPRRLVVFSSGDRAPGLARLDWDPVPIEETAQAVVDLLQGSTGG